MQKIDGPTIGTLLCRLGGADTGVLKLAPKARREYIALAMVLLSTAAIAVVSMAFAMADGLKAPWPAAILVGLFWGLVILTIDRALIIGLKPRGSKWRLFWTIMPRVVMAALLGFVISMPLTLRIFADEIRGQMTHDQIANANEAAKELSTGNLKAALDAKQAEVDVQEALLIGQVYDPETGTRTKWEYTSPTLGQAKQEYEDAKTAYEAKQKEAELAYQKWQCELYGLTCPVDDTSHHAGNGPLARALETEYNNRRAEASQLKGVMDAKHTALLNAEDGNRTDAAAEFQKVKAKANDELEKLRPELADLQAQYHDLSNRAQGEHQDGLLAQLVALEHLGDANGLARTAHLLLAGLFFMIELLPVAVKTLSQLGPTSVYDKADKVDDARAIRLANAQTDLDLSSQERIRKSAKESEERVAQKVQSKVEEVVTVIALEAVDRWAQDARRSAAEQVRRAQEQSQPQADGQGKPAWYPNAAPQQPGPYNLPQDDPPTPPRQGRHGQDGNPPYGGPVPGNGNPPYGGNP